MKPKKLGRDGFHIANTANVIMQKTMLTPELISSAGSEKFREIATGATPPSRARSHHKKSYLPGSAAKAKCVALAVRIGSNTTKGKANIMPSNIFLMLRFSG